MRACEPDRSGHRRAGRGPGRLRRLRRAGRARRSLLFTSWAIVHARQWKAQVPFLARHFRVITVEGRGNGRADRPDRRRRPTPTGSTSRTRSRCWTRSASTGRLSSACRWAGGTPCSSPPGTRTGRPGWSRSARRCRGRSRPDFDEPRASYEGWEKANRHYWLADYRGWVEFFMSAGVHRAALAPSSSRTGSAGAWRPTRETLLLTGPGIAARDRRGRRGDLPAGPLPGPGHARRPGRDRAVRDRRRAGRAGPAVSSSRCAAAVTPRTHARSGPDQPADPRLRRAGGRRAAARRPAGPGRAAGASGRCSSARRSGSGTCGATWPSPTSCGPRVRAWRSTG